MLFHTFYFLVFFLPVVLVGFYLLGRFQKQRLVTLWLIVASLFFYGWWNPKYVLLILLSISVNYLLGRRLAKKPEKPVLAAGIVFNLGLLGWYKYAMFFVEVLSAVTDSDISVGLIVLPLAISFFTFQQIAWLVDCYKGKAAHSDVLSYALFVTFFPQLIAGPIVHHREMMPQFLRKSAYNFNPERFAVGLTILTIGLFKKVIIADEMGYYAAPVFSLFETGQGGTFMLAWIGALAYTLQIYFDFSGYTDIATGIARLFGIRLPLNFYSPYRAADMIEFWRRWHITLSRFLRDYLYIPLGGNRKGHVRRYVNLMITMVLGGLWHGASWNFVIWGGLHGLYLAVNHAWRQTCSIRIPVVLARGLTFLAVVVAWVFFRAENLSGAFAMIHTMFTPDQSLVTILDDLRLYYPAAEANRTIPLIITGMLIAFLVPNTSQIMRRYKPFIGHRVMSRLSGVTRKLVWQPNVAWGLFAGILFCVSLWNIIYEPSEIFLYFQF